MLFRSVLNTGGVSTPALPTRTSNHLVGNHLKYSGIGNTDSWIPFPTSQNSAKAGGDSGESSSSNENEGETETDAAYLVPGEEPNLHNQAMSCPNTPFWEDAEACELSQITKLGTYKLVPLPPGCSAIGSKWVYKIKCDNAGNITQYCAHIITKDTPNAQALIFSRFMHLLLKLSLSESYSLLQHHWIGRFTLLTLILHA